MRGSAFRRSPDSPTSRSCLADAFGLRSSRPPRRVPMRERIRSHLTYANVMATLAVFLVLGGGTALGAFVVSNNGQIGPNTVSGHKPFPGQHANIIPGTLNAQDLAANAVNGPKIAANAVTGPKIAANAVSGPKIVDGSVGHADLAPTALTGGVTQVVDSTPEDTSTPKELT